MRKLNNKGYLLVEIIVAATLALGIGYFLVRLTIKFSKQEEDIYYSLYNTNEKSILTRAIMEDIESIGATEVKKNGNNIELTYRNGDTKIITVTDNSIGYSDYIWELESNLSIENVTINGDSTKASCTIDDSYCFIEIPIKDRFSNCAYGIKIFTVITGNKCLNGAVRDNKMYSVNDISGEYTDNECEMNGATYNDDEFKRDFNYEICENGEWVSKQVTAQNVVFANTNWFDQKMTMKWSYDVDGHKIYSPEYEKTCSREFTFTPETNIAVITAKYRKDGASAGYENMSDDYYDGNENICDNGICSCSNPQEDCTSVKEDKCDRTRSTYTQNGANDRENYCGSSYSLKVDGIDDILIVASHTTNHVRAISEMSGGVCDGQNTRMNETYCRKAHEQNTDLLCEILAKSTNSSCFSKNFNDNTDPNNSTGYPNNFNNTVRQIINDKHINLVIDLHGCASCENDFNIAYGKSDHGTIDYGNILEKLNKVSKKIKEYNTNVTSFYEGQGLIFNGVKDTGSNAILLEVNDTYLSNGDNYKKFKETLSALIDYVMEVRNKE